MQRKQTKNNFLTYEQAKLKMEKYCIYQDRCHFDVEKKLQTINTLQDYKNQILIDLLQDNFLNEERFAKNFALGKFNQKKWGKTKITYELKKRKIHSNLIQQALKEIDDTVYYQVLQSLFIKKSASIAEKNVFLKNKKIISYLVNRGFEYALIRDVLDELNEK